MQPANTEDSSPRIEDFLRGIYDNIPAGLFRTTPEGKHLFVNPTLVSMLGYGSTEELLAVSVWDIYPSRQSRTELIERLQTEGSVEKMTIGVRRKDGSTIWVSASVKAIKDGEGKVLYHDGILVDITERKSIAESLERERTTLRNLIELNPYSISIFDAGGRFVAGNQAFLDLFKSEPPEGYTLFEDPILKRLRVSDDFDRLKEGKVIDLDEIWYNPREIYPDAPDAKICIRAVIFPTFGPDGEIENLIVMAEDVTERRHSEQALQESEDKYRNLIERANDGITILQDARIQYINQRIQRMFGYTEEEILGQPFASYIDLTELPKVQEYYQKRMAGEDVPSVYETIIRHKDGSKIHAEMNVGIITYQGRPAEFVFVRDITERRQAEQGLKKSHERFLTVLDSLDSGVYVSDMETYEVLFVNRKMRDYFGDVVGKTCWKVLQGLDGPCEFCTNDNIIDDTGQPTGVYAWEFKNPITGYWLEIRDRAIRWVDGRVVRLEIAMDVTPRKHAAEALKESAERFRSVVETASDAVITSDSDGLVVTWNRAAEEIFGYTKDEAIGKPVTSIIPENMRDRAENGVKTASKAGHSQAMGRVLESVAIRKDGIKIPIEHSLSMWRTGKGVYLTAIIRDVTARKLAEEALEESEDRFRQLAENFRDALIVFDVIENRNIYINPMAEQLYGVSKRELLQMKQGEFRRRFIHEDDIDKLQEFSQQAVEARKSGSTDVLECEYRIKRSDGQTRWCYQRSYPQIKDGKIGSRFYMIVSDITERKRAEEALAESESELTVIFDNSPLMMMLLDEETNILRVNKAVEIATGRTHGDIMGMRGGEAMRCIRHLDVPEGCGFGPICQACSIRNTVVDTLQTGKLHHQVEADLYVTEGDKEEKLVLLVSSAMIDVGGERRVLVSLQDITERKQAEQGLRESEERFRLMSESTSDYIALSTFELNPKYVYLSPSHRAMGYEPEDLIGQAALKYIHPEDRIKLLPLLKKYLTEKWKKLLSNKKNDESEKIEFRFRAKSGEWRDIESTVNYLEGRMLFVSKDITERKQAEVELKKSEEKYRTMFELSPEAILYLDSSGNLLTANNRTYEWLEYQPEEIVGKNVLELPFLTNESIAKAKESFKLRLQGRQAPPYEIECISKSGKRAMGWVVANPVKDDKGKIIGELVIISNITERKQASKALAESEERFRNIAENALEWIWEIDASGKYTYASPVVEQLLGYKPEEVLEKHFYDLFHLDDREELKKAAFEAFAQKQSFREFINRNVRKDGKIVWLSTSGVPILDKKGELLGYRGADTDITERKRAEEALRSRVEESGVLADLARELLTAESIPEVIDNAIDYLSRIFPAYVSVNLIEDEGRFLVVKGQKVESGVLDFVEKAIGRRYLHWKIPLNEDTVISRTMRTGHPTVIGLGFKPDEPVVQTDMREMLASMVDSKNPLRRFAGVVADRMRHLSLLGLPFTNSSGDIVGSITVLSQHRFSRDDYNMVKLTADVIGQAIEQQTIAHALRDSEERYRALTDEALVGVYIYSDHRYLFVNPAMAEITGYTKEELLDMDPYLIAVPEDIKILRERSKAVNEGRKIPSRYTIRIHRKDGSVRDLAIRVRQIIYLGKQVALGNCIDITELTRQREQLDRAREEWERTFDATSDLIMIADIESHIVRINQAVSEYAGIKDKHPLETTLSEVFHLEGDIGAHEVCVNTNQPQFAEITDPETGRFFLISISPLFDKSDELMGTVNVARDVTEMRMIEEALASSEAQFRGLAESARDIIVSIDFEGTVLYINPAVEDILGYKPEEVIGLKLTESEESSAEIRKIYHGLLQVVNEESHLSLLEIGLKDKNGRPLALEVSARKMPDFIMAIARDITERKRMEEQLARSAKLASLGVLVGGIAHQLNNPLAVILTVSEALQRTLEKQPEIPSDLKEKANKYVSMISQHVERTNQIISGLLAFAQEKESKVSEVDVNLVVKKALQFAAQNVSSPDLHLEIDLTPSLPSASADAEALQQVVVNVIHNGIDAMEQEGRLSVRTELSGTGLIRIVITDNGPGIPDHLKEIIFEPLFTTKAGGRGTGLGLSLSVMLLERFGGRIYLDNLYTQGARFVIELPRAGKEADEHRGTKG